MTRADASIMVRAAELRRAFDLSFTEVRRVEAAETLDVVAIRVAADPYAVRLAEIAGVHADRPVTGVPSRIAELRGVAGFGGRIVPVFCLAALLGHALAASPRFLAVAADASVALAFESLDGQMRVPLSALAPAEGRDRASYCAESICARGLIRPVISIPAVVAAIAARAAGGTRPKEH
jgi:chemotaxis signal transduction protein